MAMTNAATARIVRINHDDAAMWAIDRIRNTLTAAIVIRPSMCASVVPCSRACRLDRPPCAVPAIENNVGRAHLLIHELNEWLPDANPAHSSLP